MNSKQIILRAAMGYKPQRAMFSVYAQYCTKNGNDINVIEDELLSSNEFDGEESISIGIVYLNKSQYEAAIKREK